MLTEAEVSVIVTLVDAGLKSSGIQVFRQGADPLLRSALEKMQAMADADHAERAAQAKAEKEKQEE